MTSNVVVVAQNGSRRCQEYNLRTEQPSDAPKLQWAGSNILLPARFEIPGQLNASWHWQVESAL
jgi:hypothetical protein